MSHLPTEHHFFQRLGWLRAMVLGANDGIVSTASLVIGVASATSDKETILLSGVAGLVAGAMSMASGEYVSVSSQSDTEQADLAREKHEIKHNFDHELEELTAIYMHRGLDRPLARQVAEQLMEHDALGAHARDELGIHSDTMAQPVQAAFTSAASFLIGGSVPALVVLLVPAAQVVSSVALITLLCLGLLGGISAKVGGASPLRAIFRVGFWGALAMGVTSLVGHMFGVMI